MGRRWVTSWVSMQGRYEMGNPLELVSLQILIETHNLSHNLTQQGTAVKDNLEFQWGGMTTRGARLEVGRFNGHIFTSSWD